MDIRELAVDLGPSGLDPIIAKQADEYGRRSWSMEWEPVLSVALGDTWTVELQAELQQALFEHKYSSLMNSQVTKAEKAKVGKRW